MTYIITQWPIQMYFVNIWKVWAPKKVLVTLFPYIFHIKTKWNIVYKYLKTKIFSRDTNILPQMHWTSNIFGHSATTIGVFWVSLNYPILNFKKMVCPKNVWIWHCSICISIAVCLVFMIFWSNVFYVLYTPCRHLSKQFYWCPFLNKDWVFKYCRM